MKKRNLLQRIFHSLYCRIAIFFQYRLYHSRTVILFRHCQLRDLETEAEIRPVEESMLDDILTFQSSSYVAKFRQFLKNGDFGYFAYLGRRCVHRSWVQVSPGTANIHPFWQMKLEPGRMFIHYCETAPEARGKRIYPAVLAHIAHQHSGDNTLFISTDEDNPASIKGILKAGYEEIERRRFFCLLGIKRVKIIKQ